MIRLTGTITYADGRTEAVEALHPDLAAWELYALRQGIPPVNILQPETAPTPGLMMLYLGYTGSHRGKPRAEWPSFEDWQGTVSQVDLEGESDPSQAETQVFPQVRSAG